ncbi:hypothetical protein HAZT_HAZT005695 [Hyalella azteca]|uniref:Uncharacterized protein n=1 Tax=Hyalella azteca TaxID=294128 RepID=A0A6A0GS91_HYAAZ|nr:hypothetical protein HAZT_HAZT005695 [Hyalella azteca]
MNVDYGAKKDTVFGLNFSVPLSIYNVNWQVPIVIPVIVLVVSIYLVIGPIIDNPQVEYLYASCFILAGVAFYGPFVHMRYVLPGMGKQWTGLRYVLPGMYKQ